MSRSLRGIAALVVLVVILAGIPAALVIVGRLDAWASLDWTRLFTVPDDGRLLLGLLTVGAWIAWAVVALTVIVESVTVCSGGRLRPRLPGTGWLRPVVAPLVMMAGTLLVAAPVVPSVSAHATDPAGPATNAPSQDPEDEATPDTNTEDTRLRRHTVVPGDDLWTLAARYLGDGASWRMIAEANPSLDPAARLEPGTVLVIPDRPASTEPAASTSPAETADPTPTPSPEETTASPATAPASPSSQGSGPRPPAPPVNTPVQEPGITEVTVRRGDTLWDLAETHLGDPWRWREIYHLNTDQIADPDEIDIGWRLRLPATASDPSSDSIPPSQPTGPAAPTPSTQSEKESPSSSSEPSEAGPRIANPSISPASSAPDAGDIQAPPVGGAPTLSPASPSATPSAVPPPTAQTVSPSPQAEPMELPDTEGTPPPLEPAQVIGGVASIGGVLAFGVLTFLSRKRLRQLMSRGLGRQVPRLSESARRLSQALGGRACAPLDANRPDPAVVVLGWDQDQAVALDLEQVGILTVCGSAEHRAGATAAITSSLLSASWSDEVQQVLIGRHECWVGEVDDPRVREFTDPEAALREVGRTVCARNLAKASHSLSELRSDPDVGALWQPVVVVVTEPLSTEQEAWARELAAPEVGVSVVLASETPAATHTISYTDSGAEYEGRRFTPQLISSPARRGLIELFRTSSSEETLPAPWWQGAEDLPPNVTLLRPNEGATEEYPMPVLSPETAHPVLLMLGPVTLDGARGNPPPRAVNQCAEYCAWLLTHPGRTATTMAADLQVAEPTRRSNMSRLRSWLGTSPDGEPYLPEAYSGRIALRPEVTSDWEQFTLLTAGGVNRAPENALRQALSLVRGAPLADTAPWQWQWAENMRTDMISAIRDAGVVLAERATVQGNLALARWAIARAAYAAPDDELLSACLIRIEHESGNTEEVKRLAMQITRNARTAGVDLQHRTVEILQEVTEGRRRAHGN